MHRLCAICNVLIGIAGILFFVGLTMLAVGLSGSGQPTLGDNLKLALLLGPIGIAGILSCWSGVSLWRSFPSVQKQSLVLVGCTIFFGLAYCMQEFSRWFVIFRPGGQAREFINPYDEEFVMFVVIPFVVLLLIAIQFAYLWGKSKKQALQDVASSGGS